MAKAWQWTTAKSLAAALLAGGCSAEDTADRLRDLGERVTARTVYNWLKVGAFARDVEVQRAEIKRQVQEAVIEGTVADKEFRLKVLDRLVKDHLTILAERGALIGNQVPGGATGLVLPSQEDEHEFGARDRLISKDITALIEAADAMCEGTGGSSDRRVVIQLED